MQPGTYVYAMFHWISWLIFFVGVAGTFQNGAVVGEVAAALWLLWVFAGSRAQFFQRYVLVKNGKKNELKRQLAMLQKTQQMSYEYTGRYRELEKTRKQILDAIKTNKRMDIEVIQPEIDKIDVLLDAFVRTAVTHKKVTKFLADHSEAAMKADLAKIETAVAAGGDASVVENLRSQREMVQKRIEERAKMDKSLTSLNVQLDTIEKTMQFLKTKVTAMDTPRQLQAEISNMVAGIEAAERTLAETDKIEEEARRLAQRMVTSS